MKYILKYKKWLKSSAVIIGIILLSVGIGQSVVPTGPPVGQPVSDIGSHGYFVKMIKSGHEQTEIIRENLQTAADAYELQKKRALMMKETYNRVRGTVSWLNKLQKQLRDDPNALGEKWFGQFGRIIGNDVESFMQDTYSDNFYANSEHLEKWIKDIAEADELTKKHNHPPLSEKENRRYKKLKKDQRMVLGQIKLKQAINKTMDVSKTKLEKAKVLKKLAIDAGNSKSLKESSEITNALLCQILDTQNRMLGLQTKTFDAFLSAFVTGTSEDDLRSQLKKSFQGQLDLKKEINFNSQIRR